jgi:hypothetical protein
MTISEPGSTAIAPLPITPSVNPWYNCLDVLLLTLAEHWKREHRLMFADGWRFEYQKLDVSARPPGTPVSFEDQLDVRELVERRDIESALRRYHGIVIRRDEPAGVEQSLDLIRRELLEGRPVAIGVDAYHCHWSAAFQKYHLEHYCLAIGVDGERGDLIVIDPYLSASLLRLPVDYYRQTMRDCLSFRLAPAEQSRPDWRDIVRRSAERMTAASQGSSRVQQMRDLAGDLEAHLDFHAEVARHADPYASFLVLYFKTLSFSRLNFADCLAHLSEQASEPRLAQASTRMREQGTNLYKIFLLLMKMSMTPERFSAPAIAAKLRDVANAEEALARDLLGQLDR